MAFRNNRFDGNPMRAPDYSNLKAVECDPETLAAHGVGSTRELVLKVNAELARRGMLPVTQGDYPTNRAKLVRLLDRRARLPG